MKMPDITKDEREFYVKSFKNNAKDKVEEFITDTYGENILQIVLRSHLYFENALESILREALQYPEVILTERFLFANKLALVRSLGILPHEFTLLLKYFNKSIRNKFVHDLKFELEEEHINQLINRFDKQTKDLYIEFFKLVTPTMKTKPDLVRKLISCMCSIWISIINYHQEHILQSLQEESNLLTNIRDLANNNETDQATKFIEEREVKLIQKLKDFTLG